MIPPLTPDHFIIPTRYLLKPAFMLANPVPKKSTLAKLIFTNNLHGITTIML
jgi:hypothetical protein